MSLLPSAETRSDDDSLFARAQAGDEAAWQELFKKCYPKVIRVVRRKLNWPMRSAYDSTDFANDAMKSLAARANGLDFPSFKSLLAYLTHVASSKVVDEQRKEHSLKRDVERTVPLGAIEGEGVAPTIPAPDPTASQIAVAGEVEESLRAGCSEREQEAIELKQQGYSVAEIAARTGWRERKVQRFFQGLGKSYDQQNNVSLRSHWETGDTLAPAENGESPTLSAGS
jgi:RNA polymerase sigma factor (sigma-70 family)